MQDIQDVLSMWNSCCWERKGDGSSCASSHLGVVAVNAIVGGVAVQMLVRHIRSHQCRIPVIGRGKGSGVVGVVVYTSCLVCHNLQKNSSKMKINWDKNRV